MEIREIQCDVKKCKARNASEFSLFKERKADAAGGMENFSYVFDLCPAHVEKLLRVLFDEFTPDQAKTFLEKNLIESRLG